MSRPEDPIHERIVTRFTNDHSRVRLSTGDNPELDFSMNCNGFFYDRGWMYDSAVLGPLTSRFLNRAVVFFGPNSHQPLFQPSQDLPVDFSVDLFSQDSVRGMIRRYRTIDDDLAAKAAFMLGGVARQLGSTELYTEKTKGKILSGIDLVARMAMLADGRSGDAVVNATSMYVLSKGELPVSHDYLREQMFDMTEAIAADPINLKDTKDLGLSQALRLDAFTRMRGGGEARPLHSEVSEDWGKFDDFPTVGAEFHFPLEIAETAPNFWERAAVLNASQFQEGSYVQFTRNDKDVLEVRMNPSVYPVAVATWNKMRLLMPELNRAFFTLTVNRPQLDGDFSWDRSDNALLADLTAMGALTYSGVYSDLPRANKLEQINFGEIYLGQTVRAKDGAFRFTGNWSGGKGLEGQMGLYMGYGDNFPDLAYYISMGLHEPWLFSRLPGKFDRINSIPDALAVDESQRREIFAAFRKGVFIDPVLKDIDEAGAKILTALS